MPRGGRRVKESEPDELELVVSTITTLPARPTPENTFTYARLLRRQMVEDRFFPDYIIPVSTGGIYLAANLILVGMDWVPIIGFDIQTKEKGEKVRGLNNHINRLEFRDKKVLAVEDILETGESASLIKGFVEVNRGEFALACIASRPGVRIRPDFALATGFRKTLMMPWEVSRAISD